MLHGEANAVGSTRNHEDKVQPQHLRRRSLACDYHRFYGLRILDSSSTSRLCRRNIRYV